MGDLNEEKILPPMRAQTLFRQGYAGQMGMYKAKMRMPEFCTNSKGCETMKCIKCGKPAIYFFPVSDPDIPSNPYCREHLDAARKRILDEIEKLEVKP